MGKSNHSQTLRKTSQEASVAEDPSPKGKSHYFVLDDIFASTHGDLGARHAKERGIEVSRRLF